MLGVIYFGRDGAGLGNNDLVRLGEGAHSASTAGPGPGPIAGATCAWREAVGSATTTLRGALGASGLAAR
jgi:hypothetical protein